MPTFRRVRDGDGEGIGRGLWLCLDKEKVSRVCGWMDGSGGVCKGAARVIIIIECV